MFAFEDLHHARRQGACSAILRDVDSKELALALKAASEELRQHIMKNMSERAARRCRRRSNSSARCGSRTSRRRSTRIIAAVRTLEEAGEIVLGGRGGDDELIA